MHIAHLALAPGAVHRGLSHLLSSTDNLVAIGSLYTLGVPANGHTPSHMKNQKGVLSRLFNRRRAVETKVPDLDDLTVHLAIDLHAISSRAGEPAFHSTRRRPIWQVPNPPLRIGGAGGTKPDLRASSTDFLPEPRHA